MGGECFDLPHPDEYKTSKLVRVRVVPGQSTEGWAEFFRACLKVPGGVREVLVETMGADEAAQFNGLATYEVQTIQDELPG